MSLYYIPETDSYSTKTYTQFHPCGKEHDGFEGFCSIYLSVDRKEELYNIWVIDQRLPKEHLHVLEIAYISDKLNDGEN